MLIFFLYLDRAQKRIAQQRQEHLMPLSQILDIRKQVFAHIKVYNYNAIYLHHQSFTYYHRNLQTLVLK